MPGFGLQQRLSQRMALAPHMRQALAVLQAPAMELGQLLRRESEQNPVLEVLPPASVSSIDAARADWEKSSRAPGGAPDDGLPPQADPESSGLSAHGGELDGAGDGGGAPDADFGVLGRLDDADYLYANGGNNEYDSDADEKRRFFMDSIPATESLQQHLATQLDGCALKDADRALAEEIVGSLDDDGYLRTPLADVAQARLASLDDAERMLRLVQSFDPVGIGARDLRECLLLQLRADSPRRYGAEAALALLSDPEAFRLVAAPDRDACIADALGVSRKEAAAAVQVLSGLDPRPGRRYSSERPVFVNVEIDVRKTDGRWTAFLDESGLPRVSISKEWLERRAALRGRADKDLPPSVRAERAEQKHWLDEKIKAADLIVEGMAQRQATLLAVAQAVVDAQNDYFERGRGALRPMTMSEIAEKTGFSESTISRTVAGKWLRSPRGLVQLRSFFTSGVKTSGGGMASSESVRDIIKRLISEEDPKNPLSDQSIAAALKALGVDMARRTVAKYRDQLHISVAAERRR